MKDFYMTTLKTPISINKICTVHYFEFSKDYSFVGEQHDFWEVVYVDKGEITAVAGENEILLKTGDMIFHKPNEWHTIRSNGKTSTNIVIVTFKSNSESMNFFENKVIKVGQREKGYIAEIINEYLKAFKTPLNEIYTNKLSRKACGVFGAEQMIKIYLEMLLISMVRGSDISSQSLKKATTNNHKLSLILGYMQANIKENLTLDMIALYASVSKSGILKIFHENFNMGAIEYFIKLKIDMAKKYIREGNYSFTQIAEILGYSTVHYFSRQFKDVSGMSPMEYSKSVKALVEQGKKEKIQ